MGNDKSTSRQPGQQPVDPGDATAPETPGAGENVCPDCKGSGRLDNAPCRACGGTGKVIEGIGGG